MTWSEFKALDPIIRLDRTRNMIYGIIDEVWDICKIAAIQEPIKKKQEELQILKWNFPVEHKNAKDDEAIEALKKAINDKNEEILLKRKQQDEVELSFLYIKQGVQLGFNAVMAVYGTFAPNPPSLHLKGSGDMISMADKSKAVYTTESATVGGPTAAAQVKFDEMELAVKFGTKVASRIKELGVLIAESAEVQGKANAVKAEKEATEEAKKAEEKAKKAAEEAEKKAAEEAAKNAGN